jgi:hypothetical protein
MAQGRKARCSSKLYEFTTRASHPGLDCVGCITVGSSLVNFGLHTYIVTDNADYQDDEGDKQRTRYG